MEPRYNSGTVMVLRKKMLKTQRGLSAFLERNRSCEDGFVTEDFDTGSAGKSNNKRSSFNSAISSNVSGRSFGRLFSAKSTVVIEFIFIKTSDADYEHFMGMKYQFRKNTYSVGSARQIRTNQPINSMAAV